MKTLDYTGIDLSKIDPETMDMGTELQDCTLVAQTFERMAHSTPTEAAVFATFSRTLANMNSFSSSAMNSMKSFLQTPQDAAKDSVSMAGQMAGNAGVPDSSQENTGTQGPTDQFLQGLKVGETSTATFGNTLGSNMLDWARDCIPCGLRLSAFLELNPTPNLLGALEADIKNRLSMLMGIMDLLNNFSIYGDLCELMKMLSFMCVPDLQRILTTLMALFLLEIPQLDGLIGMIQCLIAPIFAPIMLSITALLDQFVSLVTNPLECVITAFNEQLSKLNFDVSFAARSSKAKVSAKVNSSTSDVHAEIEAARAEVNQFQTGLKHSIQGLTDRVEEAKHTIENKLDFYIGEIKAMLGEFGSGDAAYLRASLKKLELVRLLSFVASIIDAMSKGRLACSSNEGKTPEKSEIDNFLDTYLNPNSSFTMWIDDDGDIHVNNKIDDEDAKVLTKGQNMFHFKGSGLLNTEIEQLSNEVAAAVATGPIEVSMPCLAKTSQEDAEKVNRWIAELNNS